MKTPRRRTLKKQIAHLQAQVRASRQRAPRDEHQTRALRALVAAYAIQFGPMKVTVEAADQIATIADAAQPRVGGPEPDPETANPRRASRYVHVTGQRSAGAAASN